ncbi:hypothetical protein BE221DRAFT_70149 [Ostreococcus tauri]|uniref:Cystinosin/ERS1p repeat n=1 Tax=Ostreococcus tauri TaxID=70448 RepID=A0A1Y5IGY1_OSTTA|nr:hypothetical protein BE221DRAFT_70149 [Ostreococcus tauri]
MDISRAPERRVRASRARNVPSTRRAASVETTSVDASTAPRRARGGDDVSARARALGACSVVVATLIAVPQMMKIHRRRSSRGVSFWTLGLTNVGGCLSVLNMYVLHYDQIRLAGSPLDDFGRWRDAQASLVFLWVESMNALSMLAVWPLAYAHVEEVERAFVLNVKGVNVEWSMKKACRYGLLAQCVVVVGCWVPALVALGNAGECAPMAWYGNLIGAVVAVLICVRFLPQVVESSTNKGSHSLSYVTYGCDILAGLVALAQKLFVTKERVSTWLPPLILHSMEAYVLVINYVNDRKRLGEGMERRRRDATPDAEAGVEYGSDEERVQSERLLPRSVRAGSVTIQTPERDSAEQSSPDVKTSWSRLVDVFL